MHITELISSFFTSTGPGGIMILLVVSLAAGTYFSLIRWILRGGVAEKEKKNDSSR